MENDVITVDKDWIAIEDYQFKILLLTSFLAENNLAYRGTLTNMCDWLGIVNAPKNTKNIKKAIEELKKKEYIFYNKEGQIHHISITNKGFKSKKVVKIRKQWIDIIKQYNIAKDCKVNRSWDTMTKVLISILDKFQEEKNYLDFNNGFIVTMGEIQEDVNKSKQTISNAIDKLTECNFGSSLVIKKKIERAKNKNNEYRTIGTWISITQDFNNETKP